MNYFPMAKYNMSCYLTVSSHGVTVWPPLRCVPLAAHHHLDNLDSPTCQSALESSKHACVLWPCLAPLSVVRRKSSYNQRQPSSEQVLEVSRLKTFGSGPAGSRWLESPQPSGHLRQTGGENRARVSHLAGPGSEGWQWRPPGTLSGAIPPTGHWHLTNVIV